MLNLSHECQMRQEAIIFGEGLGFWSACLEVTVPKLLTITIFTKLVWLVHLVVLMNLTGSDAKFK